MTHRAWDDLAELPSVGAQVAPADGPSSAGDASAGPRRPAVGRRLPPAGRGSSSTAATAPGRRELGHYVHAAWLPWPTAAGAAAQGGGGAPLLPADRRARVRRRAVVANSEGTRAELIGRLGLPPERVRVVYYGSDPGRFRPPTAAERAGAAAGSAGARTGARGGVRRGAGGSAQGVRHAVRGVAPWPAGRPGMRGLVWSGPGRRWPRGGRGRRRPGWAIDPVPRFSRRRPGLLAACDVLVSPRGTRPYGLNVHEALCCGLPALVSASAGVAERYPPGCASCCCPTRRTPPSWPGGWGLARRRRGPRRGRRPAGAGPARTDLGPLRAES